MGAILRELTHVLQLLQLDKVLFAILGGWVALLTSRRLEADRRWHSTVLELAKARAEAQLRAMRRLGELERQSHLIEHEFRLRKPDRNWLAATQLRFLRLWRKSVDELGADSLLLGDHLAGRVDEYLTRLHRCVRFAEAGFDTTRERLEIDRLRIVLDATLPPFEHPSSARDLKRNLAAWTKRVAAIKPIYPEPPTVAQERAEEAHRYLRDVELVEAETSAKDDEVSASAERRSQT